MIGLYEDTNSNNPPKNPDKLSVDYAEATDLGQQLPVTSDLDGTMDEVVPMDGGRPFKCAMSPEMVMLDCASSSRNKQAFGAIEDHWADNGG